MKATSQLRILVLLLHLTGACDFLYAYHTEAVNYVAY